MTSAPTNPQAAVSPGMSVHAWRELLTSVVESSREVVMVAGTDGVLLYVNAVGRTLLGIDEAELGTITAFDLAPPGTVVDDAECAVALATRGWWSGLSWEQPRRGGDPIPFDTVSWLAPSSVHGGPDVLVMTQRDARGRLAAEAALRTAAQGEAQLRERLVVAAETERRRVAEAIHDDPLQLLVSATVHLQLAERSVENGSDGARSLALAGRAIHDASESLRRLVLDLAPAEVDASLLDGLAMIITPMLEDRDLGWELRASADPDLRPHQQSAVLRIVREAVSNVVKHAGATTISVTVDVEDGALQVGVTDDGAGMPAQLPVRPGHLGLASMKERARTLGGSLGLVSTPGSGTAVTVRIPLGAPRPTS